MAPSLSVMMVVAVTNRAVTAIFVVSASQDMSSGDVVCGIARLDQETGSAGMAHGWSRATAILKNACPTWVTSGPEHPQQGVLIEAPLLDHGSAPRQDQRRNLSA
jgi:hypothetical protein